MAKAIGKRAIQRSEVDKVNRTAMLIGGCVAGAILVVVILSFLTM